MNAHDQLVAGLRKWTATHDAEVRAAVELLIEQGHWLRREGFLKHCVLYDGTTPWIPWGAVADLLDEGVPASGGELAVLRLALWLAQDPFGLSRLDKVNRRSAVDAFATALGVPFAVSFPNEVPG